MIQILLILAVFIASPIYAAANARSLLARVVPVVRTAGRSFERVPSSMVQSRARSTFAASDRHLPMQTNGSSLYSPYQQNSFLSRQMPIVNAHTKVSSSAYQEPAQSNEALSSDVPSLLQRYQDQNLSSSYGNFFSNPKEYILDEVVQEEESKAASDENEKDSSMLISKNKYIPEAFDELDDLQKKMVRSEENYQKYLDRYKNIKDVDVKKIKYKVDGYEVEGFILLPKNTEAKKHPLVLYSRGGHRDYGKIDLMTVMDQMIYLAQNGYAVAASQYRGSIDKEVSDEFGGKEVADNLKLLDLVEKEIDSIDMSDISLVAFSRGSIMTYRTIQELKDRLPIKAYVGIGGVSDMKYYLEENPKFIQPLLEDALGQKFTDNFIEECKKRSVCEYPEIMDDIPMLLIHAGSQEEGSPFEDPIVPTNQSKKLDNLLTERKDNGDRKAEHELILYPEKAHVLNKYNGEAKERILEFLAKHRQK
jgi:dipeptidyl aminopeptidase/acylaminoacyl peptidase